MILPLLLRIFLQEQVETACFLLYNMPMIKLADLDATATYIIGVSGGPDSMALFDMCIQAGLSIIVAHMNYQLRDSAYRDMKLVEDYACRYHVPCIIRMQEKQCHGNFEAFARNERYLLYQELYETYHASGVLLAHHMDDHIETYLMYKQRNSEGTVWGISDETSMLGCRILRPLLHMDKAQLISYCHNHQVPYGIDETNEQDDYTRNRIRHQIVEKMSNKEKRAICMQIEEENKGKLKQQKFLEQFFLFWDDSVATFPKEEYVCEQALFYLIHETCKLALSHHEISLLAQLVRKQQDGWSRILANEYEIYQEYGKLCIEPLGDIYYEYQYDQISYQKTPYFTIARDGSSTQALTLHKDDFPITIRSPLPGDTIQLRIGKKKLNRWFIDRKIPKKERKSWPVVTDCHGNVILVPKIGCDIAHFSNNPTLFVLK